MSADNRCIVYGIGNALYLHSLIDKKMKIDFNYPIVHDLSGCTLQIIS